MRSRPSLLLVSIFAARILSAQSPFQFREAWLLEQRMGLSGTAFYEDRLQLAGRDSLKAVDAGLRRGAFEAAESQYRNILDNFRQREGPTGIDVGWMLDHMGQAYLEIRDFDQAYQNFAAAAALRRANIQALEQNPQQAALLATCQSHLLKLLVALGRLDFAKGDLALANRELAEAASLANRFVLLQDAGNALYFQSLVLEKQGKWKEAESVWQEAAQIREKMTLSDPYWDMLKDMAGFYARRGDFHAAAGIVKRIQTETAGKELRPFMDIPAVPDWFLSGMSIKDSSYEFKAVSDAAMAEMLAMDRWLTDGPDAAAPFLAGRSFAAATLNERTSLRRGSDSDRARLLEFLTRRAFLHMSILLDGDPSPERVAQAYASIQRVKGGYLAAIADITMVSESDRNNSSVSYTAAAGLPVMLDELASARTRHAHMFVASALDGKPFNSREFAKIEQAEQAVTEGLTHAKGYRGGTSHLVPGDFVDSATASIDITAWERIDRAHPTVSHREYGAFVVRKGQPARYIRLGPADDIDRDVAALEAGVAGPLARGVHVAAPAQGGAADETNQRLRRLYQEVIAPLEGSLNGVTRLLIVPDGKLTLAPMDAFIDSHGQYLMQDYTVTYIGYDLLGHSPDARGPNKTTAPVVIANPDFDAVLPDSNEPPAPAARPRFEPLPGAELEAGDVRQALHLTPDRVLTGKNAREATIRSLGGPEILHFATHSVPYLDWKVPVPKYDLFEFPRSLAMEDPLLQSVIALSGANRPQTGPEDGLLTGLEIASLRLSGTKLVVLSTCEAGQGTPVDGQGVLGLRAAFSMAGVQGLVMSLWPVDDKAGRRFMQFFYSHLEAGPAEAVRLAQLDMVAKTEYKQPRFWAGYAYSGDPAVKIQPVAAKPDAGAAELLAVPTCLEVTTHEDSGGLTLLETFRVKISGAVRKSAISPERVAYDLLPPSSDLEESSAHSLNHGPPQPNPDVSLASHHNFPVSLAIERTKDQSAVYVREYVAEGDKRYKPDTVLLITLKGAPNLFSSFDIPSQFPPVASYTEASISRGTQYGGPKKIDRVGSCAAQ